MNHLLQINLGPVQGFIATARRSRDLWFGSYILSELSKAVALALHTQGAKLIFPFVNDPEVLEKQLQANSEFLVANIVFAELDAVSLIKAHEVLNTAKNAANTRWQELCNQAIRQIEKAQGSAKGIAERLYDKNIWHVQLGDVVEIFSGIVKVGNDGYAEANNRLRELMANRKNTRSFSRYSDKFRRPKSSLDGAQSTVLRDSSDNNSVKPLRKRLGIEPAEQLDTAAMVKRVVGRERGFVPTARVAAQQWIDKVVNESPSKDALSKQLEVLAKDYDQGTKLVGRYAEYKWIEQFPFDGQLLYRHRIEAEKARLREIYDSVKWQDAEKALDRLDEILKGLKGAPQPYYGLLLADGDKMGQLIDKANSADGHRSISQALSAFALSVPCLMNDYQGACIYSGGDDVLGLVPLHKAIDAANCLRQEFKKALEAVAKVNGLTEAEQPTLSVGIALVHFLHPLGDARQLAAKAEKLAKGEDRNALGLLAQPRSGNAITTRIRWDDEAALNRLETWTHQLGDGSLPRGLPHELHSAYQSCLQVIPPVATNINTFKAYWRAQLAAILNKKQSQGQDLSKEIKQDLLAQLCPETLGPENAKNFEPLQHLLMARWLSGQTPQDQQ